MKVTIKNIVDKTSCTLDVEAKTRISTLKESIERTMDVPVKVQTLILGGKPLKNEDCIENYPAITDNCKIYMSVKKPESLEVALVRILREHYSLVDCEKIIRKFLNDFNQKLTTMSLDDLERFAKNDLPNCT